MPVITNKQNHEDNYWQVCISWDPESFGFDIKLLAMRVRFGIGIEKW